MSRLIAGSKYFIEFGASFFLAITALAAAMQSSAVHPSSSHDWASPCALCERRHAAGQPVLSVESPAILASSSTSANARSLIDPGCAWRDAAGPSFTLDPLVGVLRSRAFVDDLADSGDPQVCGSIGLRTQRRNAPSRPATAAGTPSIACLAALL